MPALTKEQEDNFKKAYEKKIKIPQSKADVKLDEQLPYSDIKIPDQFTQPQSAAIGVSNTLDIGSSIAPKIIKYLYNKRTGLDMPEEQAKQMSDKIFNQAYEQNPVSYGAGRVAGEVGSGGLISKGAGGIVKGVQNYPKLLKIAEKYAEPALFGATSGATSAMRGGDAEDIATNALIGGAATKAVPKLAEGVAALPGKIRDTAKSGVRFFTGTTKELSDFITQNPKVAQQITQKGFPDSQQLMTEKIAQTKPIIEQMKLFDDASKMRTEAINHLKEMDYMYDPIKLAQTIDSKIANIVKSSKASEAVKEELKSHSDFYKNAFTDDQGNVIQMEPQQIANAIKDFQLYAKKAYKEGNPPEVQKAYREIATELRREIGRDVPKFDEYMGKAEKLVNKGLYTKVKLAEKNQGINWQNVTEQEAMGMPVDESKLQSMIFDRKRGQVGMGMKRDRELGRLNEILPQNAKVTQEDLLRVSGRKLMENPRNPGTGSASMLTGVPFGIGASAIAHNMGADYLTSSAIGSVASSYAGQKLRQEGPSVATAGYMNIKKAEDAASSLKNASTNLINKFIGTKYQKILQDAAMKGSKSFASTVFTLKSSDNDFRQQYNEIQGLDK
jgi:hypothetical protein